MGVAIVMVATPKWKISKCFLFFIWQNLPSLQKGRFCQNFAASLENLSFTFSFSSDRVRFFSRKRLLASTGCPPLLLKNKFLSDSTRLTRLLTVTSWWLWLCWRWLEVAPMLCKSFVEADEAAVCCDQVSSKLLLEFHIVSNFGFYSDYLRS